MKHDLSDITFIIPFFEDSKERGENLKCVFDFIEENFNTYINIPVCMHDDIFYRTKSINKGIKEVKTPFICIYDTDTIFKITSLLQAAHIIRSEADVVYPYDGRFVDIQRSYIQDGVIKEATSFTMESVGGAVFLNTKDYSNAGMENENIIGWGPEDVERYERLKTLGYKIERVEGKCWHITHPRGINSSPSNPYTGSNNRQYQKVKGMNKEELLQYINTWPWAKQ